MSTLSLLIVSSGTTTLISTITSSGSVEDSRLWEGDNGSLYVYNLKNELWESHNGGGTWQNIFPVAPTPSPPTDGKVTAITQYQLRRDVNDTSTGSLPDNTIIFAETSTLPSANASVYTQQLVGSAHESAGGWSFSGTTNGIPSNLGTKISDAIEDINGTAGVLIGNARVYTSVQLANDHRIYRSTDMVSHPTVFIASDEGLMSAQYHGTTYDLVSGIDITDLEIATS